MNAMNFFIVGTGFSKAVENKVPRNNEIVERILSEPTAKTLRRVWERYRDNDIEKLLTKMDLDIKHRVCDKPNDNCFSKDDREAVNRELAEFFMKFRVQCQGNASVLSVPWLKAFATEALRDHDVIVSLNYDCLLEGVLDSYDVWSPKGGYGSIVNPLVKMRASVRPNPKGIRILKIHGSVSFRKWLPRLRENILPEDVDTCNVLDLADENVSEIKAEINATWFPRSGANSRLGCVPSLPYIIAPSFVKIPHVDIARLWIEALDHVDKAKSLTIIGCGMRPEDGFLWLLLTKFSQGRQSQGKILVADPRAVCIQQRITEYFEGALPPKVSIEPIEGEVQYKIDDLLKAIASNS